MDNVQLLVACLGLALFLVNGKKIVRWATNADAHKNYDLNDFEDHNK